MNLLTILAVIFSLVESGTSQFFEKSQLLGNQSCSISAKCVEFKTNLTCLGTPLPYKSTSFAFSGSSNNLNVQEQLELWEGLKNVPKCWSVIQPLLCSTYYPECQNGRISKVPYQLCKVVKGPCRIVDKIQDWPLFLHCKNESVFTTSKDECENRDINSIKERVTWFNSSGQCLSPFLLPTEDPLAFYRDIDGCGLNCTDPRYSAEEREIAHTFIWIFHIFNYVFTAYSSLTFFLKWWLLEDKNGKFDPLKKTIGIMLACSFVHSQGKLYPFMANSNDVICRSDGTRRIAEPGHGENLSCLANFVFLQFSGRGYEAWMVLIFFVYFAILKRSKFHLFRLYPLV